MAGVSRSFFDAVKTRLEPQFPELGVGDPKSVFEVDRARREIGAPPTTLGSATENAYITSWPSPDEAMGAGRGDASPYPSPDEAMGASRGTPTQPGFFNRIGTALSEPQSRGMADLAFPWLSGLKTLNDLRNAAFPGTPEPVRPDFSALSGAKRASAEFSYDVKTHPEDFTFGPSAMLGSIDDLAKNAPSALSAARKAMRAIAGEEFSAAQVRRATLELERIISDNAAAIRSGTEYTPRMSEGTRQIMERAGLKSFADQLGNTADVIRQRMRGVEPPTGGGPPSVGGTAGAGDVPGSLPRRRATPPEITNLGNTRGGMTADQIRAIARKREADARAAEELTRPDGWWRSRKGGEPAQGIDPFAGETAAQRMARQNRPITSGLQQPELRGPFGTSGGAKPSPSEISNMGNVSGGMTAAEIRAARARRDSMDSLIKKSGQTPEHTGVGKAFQIAGEVARAMKRTMLGGELSAISRQGARLGAGHPIDTAKAWLGALRHLDPVAINAFDQASQSSLGGRMFKAAGGSFRDLEEPVGLRDIAQSEWPNKIPVLGKWYRWTERTSMAGLNAQISNVMDTWLKNNWETIAPNMPAYETVRNMPNFVPNAGVNMEEVKKLARVLTIAQGRSPELAQHLGPYMELANSTLLAPHWKVSRAEQAVMDLKSLVKVPTQALLRREIDPISKEVARNALAYYGNGAALLGVLGASGAAVVGMDPLASNFGRVEAGPVSYDLWGGNAQMARMVARMAKGEVHTRSGAVKDIQTLRPLWDWLRSGFDVAPGLVTDYLTGETLSGQKFSWKDAIAQRVTAIFAQDIQQALDAEMGVRGLLEGGVKGALQTVPAGLLGVGMNRTMSPAQQRANDAVGGDFSKAGYDEKQKAYAENPGLEAQLDAERAKAAGTTGKVEDIRASFVETQKILDDNLAKDGDKAAWYKATGDNEHDLGILISQEYKASGNRPPSLEAQPNDTPKDWYGRVIAANTDPRDNRTVDWDAVERWRATLTPEQDKYIDDHTNTRPLTGPAADRAQFKRDLRQSGFWEIKDKAWADWKMPVVRQYKTAQEYEQAVRARASAGFPPSLPAANRLHAEDAAARKDPLLQAYHKRVNLIELPWISKNAALADRAADFGVFKPTAAETALIGHKLGRKKLGD